MAVTSISSITVNTLSQASDVMNWLRKIPGDAKISISHTPGVRPFDPSEDKITARWTRDN